MKMTPQAYPLHAVQMTYTGGGKRETINGLVIGWVADPDGATEGLGVPLVNARPVIVWHGYEPIAEIGQQATEGPAVMELGLTQEIAEQRAEQAYRRALPRLTRAFRGTNAGDGAQR